MPYSKTITPAGTRFGRLVLVQDRKPGEPARCMCDCGTENTFVFRALVHGNTRSCGCFQREAAGARARTHGKSKTRVYQVWKNMIARCTKPQDRQWPHYGGRGITVCENWLTFAGFYEDMGEPPRGMTIDRIDNDRGYEQGNCRWATPSQQARNRRPSATTAGRSRDPQTGRIIRAST